MKKVIITGATGFIGMHLSNLLLERDYIVYGIGRNEEKMKKLEHPNFIPVFADFSQYKDLKNMINDEIDMFFHLAWEGGFTTAFKDYSLQLNNAKYACDAIMSAIEIGAKKFIFGGTVNEIEIKQYLHNTEYKPRYTCVHAASKVAGDMICRTLANNNNIEYCSALIPMPYGVGNKSPQVVNVLMKNCFNGDDTKLITGDNLYDVVHVKEIALALLAIGEYGHNMTSYYAGHTELKTFKQNMIEIRDAINLESKLLFGEYPEALNLDYGLIDIMALKRDSGFVCKANNKEDFIETVKWLVSED